MGIRETLHGKADIYHGIQPSKSVRMFTDIKQFYEGIASERDILTACEVGSWCGASAMRFCQAFSGEIVCVDTWLGSEEHWIDSNDAHHNLRMVNGRPDIYREFMETAAHYADRITPLPLPSAIAAKVLAHHGISFDLIYLDGDHSREGVRRDIADYWQLLNEGGLLIGDDYHDCRFEVSEAVEEACALHEWEHEVFRDNWWMIRKNMADSNK